MANFTLLGTITSDPYQGWVGGFKAIDSDGGLLELSLRMSDAVKYLSSCNIFFCNFTWVFFFKLQVRTCCCLLLTETFI